MDAMEERLLEYLTILRDFGRIYTQKILGGNKEQTYVLKLSRIKALYAFKGKDYCTMTELADNIGAKLPSMTMMVDNLAEDGFVVRERDPHDRRKVIVRLTEEGQKIRGEFLEQRRRISKTLFANLPEDEKQKLLEGLDNVCMLLEKAFMRTY